MCVTRCHAHPDYTADHLTYLLQIYYLEEEILAVELILITYESIYSTLHKYTSSWLNLPLAPVAPTESSIQQSRMLKLITYYLLLFEGDNDGDN